MKSVMSHSFSRVPQAEIQRSSFDRSHGYKTTFDAGYLIPVFIDEALPGDTFNLNMTAFARLATPLKPIMDNMFLDSFFFAVPVRLIWDNWQKFNGEQVDPGDSTDFSVPQMTGSNIALNSLSDYMGLPTGIANTVFNSLWHRAYNLIWNEWYRDQNLQDSLVVDRDDGPDTITDYVVRRRGKRHDYFTSCLPWPQKGPDVDLPLGTSAPITRVANAANWIGYDEGTNNVAGAGDVRIGTAGATTNTISEISFDPAGGLIADLSTATAATINSLREAFQLQRLYERDARGGTRYTEILKAHFNVTSPDSRLQRPEYLGGGTTPVNIHPVSQTSEEGVTPQGNLAGFGTVSAHGHGFTKSFTEHCVLIGLVSVRADLTYQQGMNRMFRRRTRFDFYWPALAHLGEQAVENAEIYYQGAAADLDVFGYQERFAEYRYKPSQITGLFRSQAAGSLDLWHLAQEFGSLPVLDNAFIQDDPPVDRVIAVPSEPHFIFDSYMSLRCARPMPVFSVPGLIDHF